MKISEKDNWLSFDFSEKDTEFGQEKNRHFKFKRNGFLLEIFNQGDEKLVVCDVVDNSVFIVSNSSQAVEAANLLGAKRFIYSEAQAESSIQFARDREFLVSNNIQTIETPPDISIEVGINEVKRQVEEQQIYRSLARLLGEHANFTEGKQQEYKEDELQDKYCRTNGQEIIPIFMLKKNNGKQEITGFFRLAKISCGDKVNVYLSDEVVEHANEDEREQRLMMLFNEARSQLGKIPAFNKAYIRVASGRESMYEKLGCSEENPGISVVHGGPTLLLKEISGFVKKIAQDKIVYLASQSQTAIFSKEQKNITGDDAAIRLKNNQ